MRPISAEASRGSSHLTSGNYKGSFTPLLQLKKFPDIPISTREESRESRPHPEEPRFRLLAREEGSFPCVVGKNSRHFRRISRGGALHRKGEINSRVVPPFPESPRCLSPFQGNLFSLHCLDFQAEDPLTPRWNVGQPCEKASWASLEGNHRSLDPRGGKRDTAATAREEIARACLNSRRGLTPLGRLQKYPKTMSALERNPQVLAPTPHKVLGPGIDGRGILRGTRTTRMGTGLS